MTKAAVANKQSADAEVASVRAWIIPIQPPIGQGLSIPYLEFKNVGKTPAFDIWRTEEFLPWPNLHVEPQIPKRCPKGNKVAFAVLMPDDHFPLNPPVKPNLTARQFDSFRNRKIGLIAHGCLHYRNVVGAKEGFTEFCSGTNGEYKAFCTGQTIR